MEVSELFRGHEDIFLSLKQSEQNVDVLNQPFGIEIQGISLYEVLHVESNAGITQFFCRLLNFCQQIRECLEDAVRPKFSPHLRITEPDDLEYVDTVVARKPHPPVDIGVELVVT